jgi:hypothetical protein
MKRMWIVWVLSLNACHNPGDKREAAAELERRIGEFSKTKKEAVDKLNKEYRETYSRMIGQMSLLDALERGQRQDSDHQVQCDKLIVKWEVESLPSAIIAAYEAALKTQIDRIEKGEAEISAVRAAYALAYQDANLELGKLKKVRADLKALSTKEDTLNNLVELAKTVGKLYNEVREDWKESEKK